MQGGCENFLSGASDHCTSTRRERRRKIFCKADAGDFLNIVLNYYKDHRVQRLNFIAIF
jgi:hypothetical protein